MGPRVSVSTPAGSAGADASGGPGGGASTWALTVCHPTERMPAATDTMKQYLITPPSRFNWPRGSEIFALPAAATQGPADSFFPLSNRLRLSQAIAISRLGRCRIITIRQSGDAAKPDKPLFYVVKSTTLCCAD